MYIVALVQNQSEMSHYGYADARPMLEDFAYHPVLYTAQNIDELSIDLKRLKFDAVVFGSNALNDKTIRDVVLTDEFKDSFITFLETGKGCLILHQLRMAQENLLPRFLPRPLDNIQPRVRAENERASDGDLRLTSVAEAHPCFLYQNRININEVKKQCLSFRSLKGLYWHYWENVSGTDWNTLLYDMGVDRAERPLIITSKEFEPFRTVLCSLTLDWQKQKGLLQNIITYVVEGKHSTAILKDSHTVSVAFEYFNECLKSRKYPFRVYDVDQSLKDFEENVKNGVHTIVIFGPFVDEKRIGERIAKLTRQYVESGKIKLIQTTEDRHPKGFYIAGRERFALRLLHDLEIKIQQELYHGYIDGSFWSTVESLQVLHERKSLVKPGYDTQSLMKVLETAKTHDRGGSYDEVFGVTCALLWLRATYLGPNDHYTRQTLKWIRNKISDYEEREKALAYHTMINIGIAVEEEKDALRRLLLAQQVKFENLSEMDLIVYLKAAVAMGVEDIVVPITRRLEHDQKDGRWIDLATTATAVGALLDALALLKKEDSNTYVRVRPTLESMIFKSIINIQDSMEETSTIKDITYPWDNKASTSLKCIHAWLKFEELIDLPIYELIDALKNYSSTETEKSTTRTALTILDELRKENKLLADKIRTQSSQIAKLIGLSSINKILWITSGIVLYCVVSLIVGSFILGANTTIKDVLIATFVNVWPFHIGVATLVATLLGVIPLWKRRGKKR